MDCYEATSEFVDASEGQAATKGKLVAWLVILDILLGWCCWTELKYRGAMELPAKFVVVGGVVQADRHGSHELHCLRYTFRDPRTGLLRQNTVHIPPSMVPHGQEVMIQYIPGEYLRSRLVIQAKPAVVTVFYTINAVLVLIGVGGLVWLSREAQGKLPRGVRSTPPMRRRIEIT